MRKNKVTCAGKTPEQVMEELNNLQEQTINFIDWGNNIHRASASKILNQMIKDQQAVKSSLVMQGV